MSLQILKACSRHGCRYSKVPPRQHGHSFKNATAAMGSEIVMRYRSSSKIFFRVTGTSDKKIYRVVRPDAGPA